MVDSICDQTTDECTVYVYNMTQSKLLQCKPLNAKI